MLLLIRLGLRRIPLEFQAHVPPGCWNAPLGSSGARTRVLAIDPVASMTAE